MTASPPTETPETTSGDRHRSEATTVRWILAIGVGFLLLLGVKAWVLEPVRVHSDSMSPGLDPGQLVWADKLSLRWGDPSRGDIVLAREPDSDRLVVKRVVAVGGDSVGIEDGILVLNGANVTEPFANHTDMDGFYFGPYLIPPGHVFLLGDNRFTSSDSRAYGPVPTGNLEGRVLFQD